jgi:hypothetical protein
LGAVAVAARELGADVSSATAVNFVCPILQAVFLSIVGAPLILLLSKFHCGTWLVNITHIN